MTIEVDIQVQGGNVNIRVGGRASSKASAGAVTAHGTVGGQLKIGAEGGSGANEDPGTGGGGPGTGSGTLVIGPIVIDCSALKGTGVDAGSQGGSGANEDPGTGGGGPGTGSGALVIGPIVICGQSNAASVSAPAAAPKGVAVNPRSQ